MLNLFCCALLAVAGVCGETDAFADTSSDAVNRQLILQPLRPEVIPQEQRLPARTFDPGDYDYRVAPPVTKPSLPLRLPCR